VVLAAAAQIRPEPVVLGLPIKATAAETLLVVA
jgi:hypothetical protein